MKLFLKKNQNLTVDEVFTAMWVKIDNEKTITKDLIERIPRSSAAGWLFVFLCVCCILYSIPRQLAPGSFIKNDAIPALKAIVHYLDKKV